jgi:UPF0176 protein
MSHVIIAFYSLTPIEDPESERLLQRAFLSTLDARSRIYISKEGINGQLSLAIEDAPLYIRWMQGRIGYEACSFKENPWHDHAFPRLSIKVRKELVASDRGIDLNKRAEHITPHDFCSTLDSKEPYILLDVRNDYEWEVGHFTGARKTPCATFREFYDWAGALAKEIKDKEIPILMYCTGGIRCEFFSPMLKEAGFTNVSQLEGGVIDYGLKVGSRHWVGKLFVFDDRMTVPLSEEESESCGRCHRCDSHSDDYYNCANMACNHLFLACKECLSAWKGCCSTSCSLSEKVRPFAEQNPHRPFKKGFHYFAEGKMKCASSSDI